MQTHTKGDPEKTGFICKKLCIYSYMFKLQSPSKYPPFDAIYLSRLFFTVQNSFWTHQFWFLLVLLPFFCFTSSTSTKHFRLRTFFIWRNKYKSLSEQDRVNRGGWSTGVLPFWSKPATVSEVWAGVLINHPSWNGQMCWKSLQKTIHWSQTQPLTTPPSSTLIQMGS